MPSVGVLELIASTAALHNRLNPAFWAELAFKRQLYSVMPQAISVWARHKGCETHYATYLGVGRPEDCVPAGLDVLFVSTPTQHSAIAYAVAAIHRARGTRIVIGGAHARAYPSDCLRHADIVVTDCDRQVIEAILAGEVAPGTIVKSARPLAELPLVEERAQEITAAAFVRGKQSRMTTVALVSSLGCPYDCDFCSEWNTPYSAFDTERMKHELDTIARDYPGALIGFHDPNFGVRFDRTIAAFEAAGRARNPFVMEASLSLLRKDRLKRLRDVGCVMVAPGIESWADYAKKTKTTRETGQVKFDTVSATIAEIEEILPSVQANLILGVDADAGDEPFALTERFVRERMKTWTNVNIPIPFGNTPFAERVAVEGRLVRALPFAFYTAPYLALRPRNYAVPDYLERLSQVYRAMVSPSLLMQRLHHITSHLGRLVLLARTAALWAEARELVAFASAIRKDNDLRRFQEGECDLLPNFYRQRLCSRLGRLNDILPADALVPDLRPAQEVLLV